MQRTRRFFGWTIKRACDVAFDVWSQPPLLNIDLKTVEMSKKKEDIEDNLDYEDDDSD